ncbi:MAG: hypothetical protein JNM27_15905 [Leptospirales bacterium]|nr:hypothetical protein [Leptospirales bacterium]
MDAVAREICRQSILSTGRTWPNPSVACVIVTDQGVFTGATEQPGRRHAEIVALDSMDQTLGDESLRVTGDMYVTLEPCSTHGRTPPCVDRIVQYPGLNIHISCMDPLLNQAGVRALQSAGLAVQSVTMPGQEFLHGFISRSSGQGPRFHLKAATMAGWMGSRKRRVGISGEDGQWIGQLLRAKLDAVVVGPGTIAVDLPGLNFRSPSITGRLKRVSGEDVWMDSLLDNSAECIRLANDPVYQPARVFLMGRPFAGLDAWLAKQAKLEGETSRRSLYFDLTENKQWSGLGAKPLPALSHPNFTIALRTELASCGFNEVLIEGGAGLHNAIALGLNQHDRVLLIERKHGAEDSWTLADGTQANSADLDVALPPSLKQARVHARYSGGTDDLVVANPA